MQSDDSSTTHQDVDEHSLGSQGLEIFEDLWVFMNILDNGIKKDRLHGFSIQLR